MFLDNLPLFVYFLMILSGSITLVFAVDLFIKSTSKLAHRLGISGYTISFLLVAISTSLPETVVAITSAVEKTPILSFGDAMGSNIALTTLVLGLPVLIGTKKGLSTRTILHSKDLYYTVFFGILPILLTLDGSLSRVDGIILITLYITYISVVWKRSHGVEKIIEKFEKIAVWKQGSIFVLSLLLLLAASETIVQTALGLSSAVGWDLAFIGVSITAFGTSLPEIAFTIKATKGRNQQQILGDIVGSVVANSTLVLGTTSIIFPIETEKEKRFFSVVFFFILIIVLFLGFAKSKEKIDKKEATLLLLTYFLFLVAEYYLQSNNTHLFGF